MSTVNVGVIGVGNCASSLVQGVAYYSNTAGRPAGLTNAVCAGYAVSDVRFTSAFDVNVSKIDRDLSEAIWTAPNNALKFADVPALACRCSKACSATAWVTTRRVGSTRVAGPRWGTSSRT